jgi:hypothetical protein
MRLTLISLVALATLFAAIAPSFACPAGYQKCGTRYCCPVKR